MDLFTIPEGGPLLFFGLTVASFATAFIGVFTGTAGGLVLLAIMAVVMPPTSVIPVHTVVQLGSGITRTMIMWRYVMRSTLPPFVVGAMLGAAVGAKAFVALPVSYLQGILGLFILVVTWLPRLGRLGTEHGRFAALGFVATFAGIFVSATGTIVAPFVAAAAPDRRNHAATLGALMTFVHIAKMIAFGVIGFTMSNYPVLTAAMIAAGAAGNWIGEEALDRISEARFRLMLQLILTALGLQLVWSAAAAAGWF
jgi:uncharacterized membrane protein YfcA